MSVAGHILGIDIGGTFTDLFLVDDSDHRQWRVKTPSTPSDPAQGVLVVHGELPETLRLARPGPMVAFAKQDAVAPGYPDAVRAARTGGFEPVLRLAGGRAAVFHQQTIAGFITNGGADNAGDIACVDSAAEALTAKLRATLDAQPAWRLAVQ